MSRIWDHEIAFHRSFCRLYICAQRSKPLNAQCTQHLTQLLPKKMYMDQLVIVSTT